MPLYEYQCDACAHRFEKIQKFSDPPESVCPVCGGAVEKLLSSPAIQFKGTGWYITDYAQKGKSGGEASSSGGDSASEKKADVPKTDGASKSSETTTSATTSPSPKD